MNPRRIFHLSLALIIAYWLYTIRTLFTGETSIPDSTPLLLLKILVVKSVMCIVLFALLKGQGEGMHQVGWKNEGKRKQLLTGAGWGLLLFVVINIALNPVINAIFPAEKTSGGIMAHFTTLAYLPIWIVFAILGGGFVEELQRIFVLTRFEKWKGRKFLYLALGLDVLSFSIGHLYQGVGGSITAGITGLLFALIYLRKRSFIEAFTAHAVYDVVGVILGHIMMM